MDVVLMWLSFGAYENCLSVKEKSETRRARSTVTKVFGCLALV